MIEMRYRKKRICFVPIAGLTMGQVISCKEITAERLGINITEIELKYTPASGGGRR